MFHVLLLHHHTLLRKPLKLNGFDNNVLRSWIWDNNVYFRGVSGMCIIIYIPLGFGLHVILKVCQECV